MGSGGSSGAISYPSYMQTFHTRLLDGSGVDTPNSSLIDSYNTAYTNNPFTGAIEYNPDSDLSTIHTAVAAFNTVVDALSYVTDFTSAYNAARGLIAEESAPSVSTAQVDADIIAYDALLTDQLEDVALPNFRAGMLNIGAVHSTSFLVGEAVMRAYKARDVAKYATELRTKLEVQRREIEANHKIQRGNLVRIATAQMLSELMQRTSMEGDVARLITETRRIHIVAKGEQIQGQLDMDESEAKWQLSITQFAANLLAGPSGGAGLTSSRPSKTASAIGGALSGAAMGAMVGSAVPGVGTAVGAAAGAALGVGMALL